MYSVKGLHAFIYIAMFYIYFLGKFPSSRKNELASILESQETVSPSLVASSTALFSDPSYFILV